MQLLTNNNYSIQYQCYSDSEDNSWSGTIDFTPDRDYDDLMSWFKAEKPDLVKHLCEFPTSNGRDPKLEQFWLIITSEEDMISALEDISEEEFAELSVDCNDEDELRNRIKGYAIHKNPNGFVQWHKHPKRMSQYGRDTLTRLTGKEGVYTLLGLSDNISIDTSDYNTWEFNKKKTA